MEKICAGIDLGTTNSCIAILEEGVPVVIPNDLGERTTPSIVSVLADGSTLVGNKARSRSLTHSGDTFASIKRRMGERYSPWWRRQEFMPENVSALILGHLKASAEQRLGRVLEDVVITVPANFNSVQRQATKDAGEIAGLNVLRVLNEPTAAALAYGHGSKLTGSLCGLRPGRRDFRHFGRGGGRRSLRGNPFGGRQSPGRRRFQSSDRSVDRARVRAENRPGYSCRDTVPAAGDEWAIAAKHALSKSPEVRVKIENLFGGQSFDAALTRAAFEEMVPATCSSGFSRSRGMSASICGRRGIGTIIQSECSRTRWRGATSSWWAGRPECRRSSSWCRRFSGDGFTRTSILTRKSPKGAALQAGIIQKQGAVKDVVLVDRTAAPGNIRFGWYFLTAHRRRVTGVYLARVRRITRRWVIISRRWFLKV